MATSGTVAQTTILVDDVIVRAAKRCKFKPSEITAEVLDTARQNLYMLLSNVANHGVTLWTQRKTILAVQPNKLAYDLPSGTVDVKNALFRSVTLPAGGTAGSSAGGTASNAFDFTDVTLACTQTSADGNISYNFGTTVTVPVVGVMVNGNATLNLVWEYSSDNSTWTAFYSPGSASYTDLLVEWADINAAPSAQYYRVRETGGATLNVRKVIFAQSPSELPMARLNRDDYTSQPNKTQTGGQSLQYFVQRLENYPQMLTWPVPNGYFGSIVAWNFRHIQDVGDLTNTLEIPQRWVTAVVAMLAAEMAEEYPDRVDDRLLARLQERSARKTREAEDEERDDSPIYLGPNLSPYTA